MMLPHYLALGATLYMPATRADLGDWLGGTKPSLPRSLALCTEDAIREDELPLALANIERVLRQGLEPSNHLRLIRPRNPTVLRTLARMPGFDVLDGVILPKADAGHLPIWLDALHGLPSMPILPTVETAIAFDHAALCDLRESLLKSQHPVLAIRIGGNDLLNVLGLRRPRGLTLYDTPLGGVIDDIVRTFRPAGFEISAPVFEILDDPDTLRREIVLDMARGLYAKTAIHPSQVTLIERMYRPQASEVAAAERVLDPTSPAVFRFDDRMCEPATHCRWAENVRLRAQIHGVAD